MNNEQAVINVSSIPQQATLKINDSAKFELTGDDYYDLNVTLNSIENNTAKLDVLYVQELIMGGEEIIEETEDEIDEVERPTNWRYYLVTGLIILLISLIVVIVYRKLPPHKQRFMVKK